MCATKWLLFYILQYYFNKNVHIFKLNFIEVIFKNTHVEQTKTMFKQNF